MLFLGTTSALLGVMYALMEHDLKRLLAFHSVENIGIILLGIGAGMIFQSYGLKELAALGLLAGSTIRSIMPCLRPTVLRSRLTALCDTYAQYGGVRWLASAHALDGVLFFDRSRVDFRFASHQWICERVAGVPKSLPEFSDPDGVSQTDAADRRGDLGPDRRAGLGLLRKSVRDCVSRPATERPCASRAGGSGSHAHRDGIVGTVCVVLGLAPMVVVPMLDRVVAPLAGLSIEEKVLALDGWALAPVNVEFSSLSTPVLGAAAGGAGDAGAWDSPWHSVVV